MPARLQLIVVSNRGPVSFSQAPDGQRIERRGAGGLATALRGLLDRHDVTWIASAMTDEDRVVAGELPGGRDERTAAGSPYRLRLLAHERSAYNSYYSVVANPLLWFAQHALWGLGKAPVLGEDFAAAWEGYAAVNRAFADAVVAELDNRPGAAVLCQDYHLYLAPRYVRDARPDAALLHFVHIPWPGPEMWSALPAREQRALHEGLLANDLVGFHTERWCRNFRSSAGQIAGAAAGPGGELAHAGRTTHVFAAPISVDVQEFETLAESPDVLEAEAEIVSHRPERLIVRVDRTDPSKNIVRGLAAFSLLLDRYPEWRGRVVLLALLDPSRQNIPEYSEYREAIERAADDAVARHGAPGYIPVELRIEDDFARSVAAYKQYDVLFVNAVFDGLNLVAKEAPLVNRQAGAVVLSVNTGAYEELKQWVIPVDPVDIAGQADALHAGLTLARDERTRRAEAIRAHVRQHDLAAWLEEVLDQLPGRRA